MARRQLEQPQTLLPLQLNGNELTAGAGLAVLRGINPLITSRTGAACIMGLKAAQQATSQEDAPLGRLCASRFMVSARNKLWWCTPEWGTTAADIPPETQFLMAELEGARAGPPGAAYACLIPLIDQNTFRATLRPPAYGAANTFIRVESGDDSVLASKWNGVLLVAAGTDPYELADWAMAQAAQLSGGAQARSLKKLPATLDLFGWCTWDAFYFTVSAQGVREGLASLTAGGTQPGYLILDDGWQMTDTDREYSHLGVHAMDGPPQSASTPELSTAPTGAATGQNMGAKTAESRPHPEASASNASLPAFLPAFARSGPVGDVLTRLSQMLSWTEVYLLKFAQWAVDHVLHYAFLQRSLAALAAGPLRGAILRTYAASADHMRRLTSVRANAKFADSSAGPNEPWKSRPSDLGAVVKSWKSEFPGLRYVYAWHALHAYWNGVSPTELATKAFGSVIMQPQPTPGTLEVDPSMAWSAAVLNGVGTVADPVPLHTDMHAYLQECGVDGVKVDVQGTIGLLGSKLGGGPALAARYHQSLEDSIRTHFRGNHCVNCMCHSSENLFRMEDTAIARVSDDFYPLDSASWSTHIGVCAFNTLYMGTLIQPDWDMFHSKHPAALLHASARVLSGGPVYVSDKPGRHNFDLLRRLVLPDGSILRPNLPGRPTADCLFLDVLRDDKSLLKVWNRNSYTGLLGVFNVQGSSWSRQKRKFHTHNAHPPTLAGHVRPSDVPGLSSLVAASSGHTHSSQAGGESKVAVWSDKAQKLSLLDYNQDMAVRLFADDSDVFTLAPCQACGSGVTIAPIGLVSMLNPGGAIRGFAIKTHGGSATVQIDIKGCGPFLLHSTRPASKVELGSIELRARYLGDEQAIVFEMPETSSLENQVIVSLA